MYITSHREKKSFKTKEASSRIRQKFIYKFDLSKTLDESKEIENFHTERKIIKPFETMDKDNNDDFLLCFYKRFDDIFKKLKGHEKLFEELKKRNKNRIIPNSSRINVVYKKKLNYPKKKIIPMKIDKNKIIEIQKIFKGHFIRNINLNIDRMKLRQCLVELFCLLLYGHWSNSQKRYNFYLFKEYYITAKLYAGEELSFVDRISLKLPHCYYVGTKINYLKSKKIGEEIIEEEE